MSNGKRKILIIDGHPDGDARRFVHALAASYEAAARASGHEVRTIRICDLHWPPLAGAKEFLEGEPSEAVRAAQEDLAWCDHATILFPLWLGALPASLKGFFEQVLRPGFAFGPIKRGKLVKKLLAGRSARVVVTMGMPAFVYRWYFRAHSLKSLERNILRFVGFGPVRASLVGSVEASAGHRERWLTRMRRLGAAAA